MINNGANNELQTSLKVPCDCDDVFDAIESAIKTNSYSIQSSNKLSHTIMFKTPTSLTSYGEDVTINVGESFDGKTEIGILCIPRNNNLQPANLAKARKNFNNIIEQISTAVSKCKRVEGKTQAGGSTQVSPAAQIKEFKELLDIGAITREEYELKKTELLGLKKTGNTANPTPHDDSSTEHPEAEFNSDSQTLDVKESFFQEESSGGANVNQGKMVSEKNPLQEKQEPNNSKNDVKIDELAPQSGEKRAIIAKGKSNKGIIIGVICAVVAVIVCLVINYFNAVNNIPRVNAQLGMYYDYSEDITNYIRPYELKQVTVVIDREKRTITISETKHHFTKGTYVYGQYADHYSEDLGEKTYSYSIEVTAFGKYKLIAGDHAFTIDTNLKLNKILGQSYCKALIENGMVYEYSA